MGTEKAAPGEGEAGPELTEFHYEDGEGHGEPDAPDEHAPVNYVPFRVSSLAPSEKGTQVESRCPKGRKTPMMGLVPRPEDGHMVIMVVRQVSGTRL